MTTTPEWWNKPRLVSVVVDNPSWILPCAERLVTELNADGDDADLCRSHDGVREGAVAFYLGCTRITPPDVLARNRRNLVVHESDLPNGRGFSPLTWQIVEGKNDLPICLLEAVEAVDAGPVIYRDRLCFEGHELNAEIRERQGSKTIELCRRFMAEPCPPEGAPQVGNASHYTRRDAAASRLDPTRSIAEQFNLLRVVDNERYPAFFDLAGRRYRLAIEKMDPGES